MKYRVSIEQEHIGSYFLHEVGALASRIVMHAIGSSARHLQSSFIAGWSSFLFICYYY